MMKAGVAAGAIMSMLFHQGVNSTDVYRNVI